MRSSTTSASGGARRRATPSPNLDPAIQPLGLSSSEVDDLVAYLEALDGQGYEDTPPLAFPQ